MQAIGSQGSYFETGRNRYHNKMYRSGGSVVRAFAPREGSRGSIIDGVIPKTS